MRRSARHALGLTWLAAALAVAPLTAADSKRRTADETIARNAAILATNRLAEDIADENAFLLLQLASRLIPTDDVVKGTLGLIAKEMTPDPIPTKLTEPKFLETLLARGEELATQKRYPRLASLYLQVAEKVYPAEAKFARKLRELLEQQQVTFTIEELLGNTSLYDQSLPVKEPVKDAGKEPVKEPTKEPAKEPKVVGPLLDPATADGKPAIFAWDGENWRPQPLSKVVFKEDKDAGEIKNTLATATAVLLCRNRPLTGDFDLQIELKGGKEVVLQPNADTEERFACDVPATTPVGWHTYRFQRRNGQVLFWLDGRERFCRRAIESEDGPLIFGVLLRPNDTAQFKRLP